MPRFDEGRYEGLSFKTLLEAGERDVLDKLTHINQRYLNLYWSIIEGTVPKGIFECGPNESLVDWCARTYGVSSTMFHYAGDSEVLRSKEIADHIDTVAMASTIYLYNQSRPPVFYIEDIAEEFRRNLTGRLYREIFAPLLSVPLRLPYESVLFVCSMGYFGGKDTLYNVAVHAMQLEDTILTTTYLVPRNQSEPTPPLLAGHVEISLDPDSYELVGHSMYDALSIYANRWTDPSDMPIDTLREHAQDLLQSVISPALYTMFLLNCRNVDSVEDDAHRSRQERRARERKGLSDNKSYRVRVKLPSRKQYVYYGGRSITHHPDVPMHMVRGHFSHYTEEKPLFGKYAGTFWIPAHIRGSKYPERMREGYEGVLDKEANLT
jgi:hypothetical protein